MRFFPMLEMGLEGVWVTVFRFSTCSAAFKLSLLADCMRLEKAKEECLRGGVMGAMKRCHGVSIDVKESILSELRLAGPLIKGSRTTWCCWLRIELPYAVAVASGLFPGLLAVFARRHWIPQQSAGSQAQRLLDNPDGGAFAETGKNGLQESRTG